MDIISHLPTCRCNLFIVPFTYIMLWLVMAQFAVNISPSRPKNRPDVENSVSLLVILLNYFQPSDIIQGSVKYKVNKQFSIALDVAVWLLPHWLVACSWWGVGGGVLGEMSRLVPQWLGLKQIRVIHFLSLSLLWTIVMERDLYRGGFVQISGW